jgi:thiamine biosynthesis lipoprotein
MKKKIAIILILISCSAIVVALLVNRTEQYPAEDSGKHRFQSLSLEFFDTLTQIIGYADSQEEFDYFVDIIYSQLRTMHMLFDIYNEFEGINNLRTINQNAGIAPIVVDNKIVELIEASIEAYHLTNGTLNIALGPVLEIWHTHRHAEVAVLPCMDALREADRFTDISAIIIDSEARTVFLPYAEMSLDVGSVAKGFALDKASAFAREAGFQSFLLNMGGDVVAADPPPGREFWNIGVEEPTLTGGIVDAIQTSNTAVLVSGDYRRYFVVEDISYSHIIDPATLMPAQNFSAVTVIHPSATYAEILSTAVFIMDIDSGMQLLSQFGAEAIWIFRNGEIFTTPGYLQFSRDLN